MNGGSVVLQQIATMSAHLLTRAIKQHQHCCVFAMRPLTLHVPAGPDHKHWPALHIWVMMRVHLACAKLS